MIYLILNFARSGGTLFNKELINFKKDVFVLSEAHPLSNKFSKEHSLHYTFKKMFGVDLRSSCYEQQMIEIIEYCNNKKIDLFVRDWTYIDFYPSFHNNFKPKMCSYHLKFLQGKHKIKTIAVIRDAIDVCISNKQPINKFFQYYHSYVEFLLKNNIEIFKYEDMIDDKVCFFKDIGIKKVSNGTSKNNQINGDVSISRGNKFFEPKVLPRRWITQNKRKLINRNKNQQFVNKIFNYPISYEEKPHETFFEMSLDYLDTVKSLFLSKLLK